MNKINPKLILAALLGFSLSIILIIFLNKNLVLSGKQNIGTTAPIPTQNQEPVSITIALKSEGSSSYKLDLIPKTTKVLSGFSIRLPISESATFIPNPDLLTNSWVFPINKVSVDRTTGKMTLDISAINPTPTGYQLSNATTLGIINSNSILTIGIDKGETKILAKDASELNYTFTSQ